MATTTISIHVDERAAEAFAAASTEEQRKIELLLSLRLQDFASQFREILNSGDG